MKKIMVFLLLFSANIYSYNIGLLVVATGKYIQFVAPLIKSAEEFFCKNHNITYFVFTDGQLEPKDNVIVIPQNKLGWPFDTMMRCAMYDNNSELFKEMDYLFACDSDMRFVNYVDDEVLSERVATLHPGYVGTRGTYELRQNSSAYIGPHEGNFYFAGGFHGGSKDEFLRLVHTMHKNIVQDLSKEVTAVWHDESHLNRYFVDNPPTCILSPSYCFPESREIIIRCQLQVYEPKLIALDKNHGELRR